MADLLDIAGVRILRIDVGIAVVHDEELRSEEHTSELQCQISYAVFCLKKKKKKRLLANQSQYANSYASPITGNKSVTRRRPPIHYIPRVVHTSTTATACSHTHST